MRALPAALLISVALHGGAIAWFRMRPGKDTEATRPVTQPTVEVVPAPAAEPAPMMVTLLDDNTVVAPAQEQARASQPDKARISRSAHTAPQPESGARPKAGAEPESTTVLAPPAGTEPTTTEPAGTDPAQRNPMMSMRKPQTDLAPSSDFTERFLKNSKPLAPKSEVETEQLADELATIEGQLKNPGWVANASPHEVTGARARALGLRDALNHRELKSDGPGTKSEHRTFSMKFSADGTAKISNKGNIQRKGLGATFDGTDALMRAKGIDPYSSYKLKVLDETRDERVAIGKRYRTQQLAKSKQLMQTNLERLWATTFDPAARKQGLFELWDDCAESGPDEVVAGGTAAREYVVGFIRSKFPAGDADAFTATELARMNKQRKSRATFAPY